MACEWVGKGLKLGRRGGCIVLIRWRNCDFVLIERDRERERNVKNCDAIYPVRLDI